MQDVEVVERVETEGRRTAFIEFVSNVLMAVVLGYLAWRIYGLIRPLIIDDSIPYPVTFAEAPTVEDHLPDDFVSPDDFELAQSRFVGETPSGFRYWLLASTEDAAQICLLVEFGEGVRETNCDTLEGFAASGITTTFSGASGEEGEPYIGAGRFLAEDMELIDPPPEAKSLDLFFFVEGPEETFGGVVDALAQTSVSGGRELEDPDDP